MQISGVVLAGGRGSRMGGLDKGWVEFMGKPMVSHVIARIQPQVSELFINANRELERYSDLGLSVIQDDIPDFAGPLAGLHKAMKVANTPYVLAVPCDTPLLPTNLVERMMNTMIAQDAEIVVAKTGMQSHPVFCLCRKSLLPSLEAFLQEGGRKVEEWQKQHELAVVFFDENPQAFANVNTQDELVALEKV